MSYSVPYLRVSRTNGDYNERGEWKANMVPIEDREFERHLVLDCDSTGVSLSHFDAPKDGKEGVFQLGVTLVSASCYCYPNETELRRLYTMIGDALQWCDDCRRDS